jgi:hypothetical protein
VGCVPEDDLPELNALWQGLADGMPMRAVLKAINANPERLVFNSKRRAIQVVGCQSTVIAHISLSPDDAKALAAALQL